MFGRVEAHLGTKGAQRNQCLSTEAPRTGRPSSLVRCGSELLSPRSAEPCVQPRCDRAGPWEQLRAGRALPLVSALHLPYLIRCQVLGEICLRGYLDAFRFLEENGMYAAGEVRADRAFEPALRGQSVTRGWGSAESQRSVFSLNTLLSPLICPGSQEILAPLDKWEDGDEPGTSPRVPALSPRSNPVCSVKAVLLVFLFPINYVEPLDKQRRELSGFLALSPRWRNQNPCLGPGVGPVGLWPRPLSPAVLSGGSWALASLRCIGGCSSSRLRVGFPVASLNESLAETKERQLKGRAVFLDTDNANWLFSVPSHWLGAGVPPGRGRCGSVPPGA